MIFLGEGGKKLLRGSFKEVNRYGGFQIGLVWIFSKMAVVSVPLIMTGRLVCQLNQVTPLNLIIYWNLSTFSFFFASMLFSQICYI